MILAGTCRQPIVLATDPKAEKNIICDTFLRFKGLEGPAETFANHFRRWYFHAKESQRIVEATELARGL